MALTNREHAGKAMDLLKQGLAPIIERELANVCKDKARPPASRCE